MFESEGPVNGVTGNGAGGGADAAPVVRQIDPDFPTEVHSIEEARDEIAVILADNRRGWRKVRALRQCTVHEEAAWEHQELSEAMVTCLRQNDLHEGQMSDALQRIREACQAILDTIRHSHGDSAPRTEALCDEANRLSLISFCVEDCPMAPEEEYNSLFASATTLCAIIRAATKDRREKKVLRRAKE